jgi:uncharacterized Zn finger protein (UPF0148 family)
MIVICVEMGFYHWICPKCGVNNADISLGETYCAHCEFWVEIKLENTPIDWAKEGF